jgi:hypothetical protein
MFQHLPKRAATELRKRNVANLESLIEMSNLSIQELITSEPSTILDRFLAATGGDAPFSSRSKRVLASQIEGAVREFVDGKFSEMYRSSMARLNASDIEGSEDDDFMPDLDLDFPTETLFIGVTAVKGNLPIAHLEDLIYEIESAVADELGFETVEDVPSKVLRGRLLEVFTLEDWPSTIPIYASIEITRVYPEIIVQLMKKAGYVFR